MAAIPTLNIYGRSARWLVSEGTKLLTLRLYKPKYAGMRPGADIVIQYDNDETSIGHVFSQQNKPLAKYQPAELLLDGFMNVHEAVNALCAYPGYENVTQSTPMLGIGFSSWARFNSYIKVGDHQKLYVTPLTEAVLMPEYRGFFFPSYLWWLAIRAEDNGESIDVGQWHDLLVNHLQVVDQSAVAAVRNVNKRTQSFYKKLDHGRMVEILKYESTASPLYRSLVLLEPLTIDKA